LSDFSVVQDATDETTFTEKPSAAASWGKEEKSALEDESVPAAALSMNVEKEVASTQEPAVTDVTLQNPSEADLRNETEASASDLSKNLSFDSKSGDIASVPTTKDSER